MYLNICFQFLNNITCIFIYFFINIYFQKIQTILLEQYYQAKLSILKKIKKIVKTIYDLSVALMSRR